MAGTIVIVRPSFFVDQLCRSRDDPTVTFTAHGEINVFSQWIDFTVDQPSLEQPGKQLDWAAAVEFVNPTDPSQSAGFYSICPAGFIPADLSATRPAFVLTGARLVLWPGPFSPLRDKHGQYIGFLVAQFPVGVTRLNRSEISSYLVLN